MTLGSFQLECLCDADLLLLKRNVAQELARRNARPHVVDARMRAAKQPIPYVRSDRDALLRHNSQGLKAVPKRNSARPHEMLRYLPALMAQDWSGVYPDSGGDRRFYVYAHVDPREPCLMLPKEHGGNWGGQPFYIGKGCDDRAYDLKRNEGHGRRLRILRGLGYEAQDVVKIVYRDLTESEAMCIESKLIYFFGSSFDSHGRSDVACLLNIAVPQTPEFSGRMVFRLEGDAS